MRTVVYRACVIGLGAVLLQGCASYQTKGGSGATMAGAHAHIGHVLTSWKDTPGRSGLLPILHAEAQVAAQHAAYAVEQPHNLKRMQTYTRHVRNAIDPGVEGSGPGLGYGVIRAARGVAQHITLAASSPDASANVKLHARHVATSAQNVVSWSKQVLAVSNRVLASRDAAEAAGGVKIIKALTQKILHGADANHDGKITWKRGEGGISEISKHMEFMKKGEGMK